MKRYILHLSFVLASLMLASFRAEATFELPETWTKEFAINISFASGLKDESTYVTFTYDSCLYTEVKGISQHHISFALTDAMRAEILQRMKDLEVVKIKSRFTPLNIVPGAPISYLSFNTPKKEYMIQEGAVSELYGENPGNYFKAFDYLMAFAQNNTTMSRTE